jgi:hypothetical protein
MNAWKYRNRSQTKRSQKSHSRPFEGSRRAGPHRVIDIVEQTALPFFIGNRFQGNVDSIMPVSAQDIAWLPIPAFS